MCELLHGADLLHVFSLIELVEQLVTRGGSDALMAGTCPPGARRSLSYSGQTNTMYSEQGQACMMYSGQATNATGRPSEMRASCTGQLESLLSGPAGGGSDDASIVTNETNGHTLGHTQGHTLGQVYVKGMVGHEQLDARDASDAATRALGHVSAQLRALQYVSSIIADIFIYWSQNGPFPYGFENGPFIIGFQWAFPYRLENEPFLMGLKIIPIITNTGK